MVKLLDMPTEPEAFPWEKYTDGLWRLLENREIDHYFGGSRDRAIGAGRGWANRNGYRMLRKRMRDGVAYVMLTAEQEQELKSRQATPEQSAWTDRTLALTAQFLRDWASLTNPDDLPPSTARPFLAGILAAADRIDPAKAAE